MFPFRLLQRSIKVLIPSSLYRLTGGERKILRTRERVEELHVGLEEIGQGFYLTCSIPAVISSGDVNHAQSLLSLAENNTELLFSELKNNVM